MYTHSSQKPFYLHFKQMKSIEPLIYSVHSTFGLNVRMVCATKCDHFMPSPAVVM